MGYIDLFISRLHSVSSTGEAQDMVSWFNFVAFDIIGDLTMGESFNCLEASGLHPWVQILFKHFKSAVFVSVVKRFPLAMRAMPLLVGKKLLKVRAEHQAFTREKVLRRMNAGSERGDFMSGVLRHNDKEVRSFSSSWKTIEV